jgi:ubiquinone/menaquinone biosynthesis C-methylase UbiE
VFTAATAYERFMGRWSRRLAKSFAEFAGVGAHDRVLDVGCGTGALAGAILAAHPESVVTGIDPSEVFVESCRAQYPSARFLMGDAQQLPFGDQAFDASLACLVLNFVASPRDAVAEMARVTAHNGTIAAAVWDHAEGMTMLRAFWEAAVEVDPSLTAGEKQPMLSRDALAQLWDEVQLHDVLLEPLVVDMKFASFNDYWEPFMGGQGPAGAYVASLTPESRDAIARVLHARFLKDDPFGSFTIQSRAWAIKGTVGAR